MPFRSKQLEHNERLQTRMAPASWPDDDDRHVSNFMTIKTGER